MKKVLMALALVPLLGAGCAGGSSGSSATPGVSEETTVAWVYNSKADCAAVLLSPKAAKAVGYPAGEGDMVCISDSTISKLNGGDEDKTSGSARVTLGGLKQLKPNLYTVDVLTASSVK